MRVLVACEFSGIVRDAFKKLGHDAWSCDILDTEIEGNHIKGDVLNILEDRWDLMIAHPPCTYLTVARNKYYNKEYSDKYPNQHEYRKEAIDFFMSLINAPIKRIAVENPIGSMSTVYRKPDQIIQPYMFGHPDTKATCLWLKNLSRLQPTNIVKPIFIINKNGTRDSLTHYHSGWMDKEERWKFRSRTYKGIAKAMAEQWSKPFPLDTNLEDFW